MSRTLWIVHQYASTPDTGMGGRQFYLARELAKLGHKVYLIASSFHHLLRQKPEFNGLFCVEEVDGFNMIWVKMPVYREAHSRQRALNWFIFPWRIQKLADLIPDKPDTILCSSPSPISYLGAQRLAKKFNARMVFEVRDIWPLTLTKIGGVSVKHPFIRLMQWVEDKAYLESDAVVSNLKNSVEHMMSRGMEPSKFSWIPNGFSMDEVKQEIPLDAEVVNRLPKDKFIVGYTGTLGAANAIDTLIYAAEFLRQRPDIAFVIVGDGKEKGRLQKLVAEKGLAGVFFIDPIPKIQIQAMLDHFDACYIGWLDDPLYLFGIGANKIPEYLYAGKPIIHGYSGSCDPVGDAGAGLTVPAEDPAALADAVQQLSSMSYDERACMGAKGYLTALERYDYSKLAKDLERVLFPDAL